MHRSPSHRSAIWLLVLAVLAVGPAAVLIRLAAAPPITVAFYRMLVAAVAIAIIVTIRGGRDLHGLDRSTLIRSVVAGVLLAVHFATWITSLEYTSVANSVIIVTTQPVWAALLGVWYLRERIHAVTFAAIALALAGVAIISGGNPQSGGRLGDLLALIGAIMAASYLVVGRQVRQRASTLGYVLIAYSTAALTLGLWGLIVETPFVHLKTASWPWIIAAGLGPSVIGHTLYNRALKDFSAHAVATTILGGETIVATALAMMVLGEFPSPWAILGAVPIAIGVIWTLRLERRQVLADQT
ncbi:MAG: DMT family transporter [candidate division Zixibacteria bacterium]|nr:DMT family transporter [candidate division Zixibacteria bacterium]